MGSLMKKGGTAIGQASDGRLDVVVKVLLVLQTLDLLYVLPLQRSEPLLDLRSQTLRHSISLS